MIKMADNHAYFYNSKNGDRVYNADSMTDWLRPFFVTGVFNGELQVTANDDMTVTVAGGYCNIGGKVKNFISATKIDLETASGTLDRIDTVILRRNDTERDIQIIVQTGGYSSNPSPSPLVRQGAYYDLKLAEIYVAAGTIRITQAEITDTRMDKDACGWVCSTMKEIDFTQITAQFNAYFAQYQGKITAQFKTYVAYMTNLEQQGDAAYQSMLSTFFDYARAQETRFDDLYEEMRDLIGEAAAAQLQNQIDDINAKIGTAIEDLATKLVLINDTKEDITGQKFTIINTDTGKSTVYEYTDGEKVHLTEHGDYTISPQNEKYSVIPDTFRIDHTTTTETLDFNICTVNGYAYVGGYVGGYVASGNN